ncbi:MAG: AfsR/SARP family transcriptional regulator, partial [Spirochaetia bacterium]
MIKLNIRLFGPPEISVEDRPVKLHTKSTDALLYYLAAEPGRHSREQLAGLLWPDSMIDSSRGLFRNALYHTRKKLQGRWISADKTSIELIPGSGMRCDFLRFKELANAAEQTGISPETRMEMLAKALDLSGSPFLEGFSPGSRLFENWKRGSQREIDAIQSNVFREIVSFYRNKDDLCRSKNFAERWYTLQPYNEEACRTVMLLLALTGNRVKAVEHYKSFRDTLQREMGMTPDPMTETLLEEITAGKYSTVKTNGFPDCQSALSREGNLPVRNESLISREEEISQLENLLKPGEVVTLTGVGGAGKTSLANTIGQIMGNRFPGGVWYVELVSLPSGGDVSEAAAAVLGIGESVQDTGQAGIIRYIGKNRLLLILDNCEHVLESCGAFVERLMEDCPNAAVLTTTREPLRTRREIVYRVPPLSYPDPDSRTIIQITE